MKTCTLIALSLIVIVAACATEEDPIPYLMSNAAVGQDASGSTDGDAVSSPDSTTPSTDDASVGSDEDTVAQADSTDTTSTDTEDSTDTANSPDSDSTDTDSSTDEDASKPEPPNCQKMGQPGFIKSYCDFIGPGNLVYRTVTYDDNNCEVTIKAEQCACACGYKDNLTGVTATGCVNSFTNSNSPMYTMSWMGFQVPTLPPITLCVGATNNSAWSSKSNDGQTASFTNQTDEGFVIGAAKGTPFLTGSCFVKDLVAGIKTVNGKEAEYAKEDGLESFKTTPAGSKVTITAWWHKGEACNEAPKACANCSNKVPAVKVYTSGNTPNGAWPKPENVTYLKTLDLDSKAKTFDVYPTETTRFVYVCREAGASNVMVAIDQFTVEQIVCP